MKEEKTENNRTDSEVGVEKLVMQRERIAIFDLDGTLAIIDHRRHLVEGKNKKWDKFYSECDKDLPNKAVIKIANILFEAGYYISIFSGRSYSVYEKTTNWLINNGVRYHYLKMREINDFTPDDELKKSWLNGIDKGKIEFVFDDRNKVVKMWRDEGLICFQVANGDF